MLNTILRYGKSILCSAFIVAVSTLALWLAPLFVFASSSLHPFQRLFMCNSFLSPSLLKLLRYVSIYGPIRVLYKASGRSRDSLSLHLFSWCARRLDVAVVGCGQFAYSTISYFLNIRLGRRLLACFDIDPIAASSLARSLDVSYNCSSFDSLISLKGLRTLFVASSHSSHADYASRALEAGIDVYVEKPVAISISQLARLESARLSSSGRIFAGYNRPFSGAILDLRRNIRLLPGDSFTVNCFVAGHFLGQEHWYRLPGEGTRICGNAGHWIDLFLHILAWRSLPEQYLISLNWAYASARDDNLSISISTELGDLFSFCLTSRHEPFEGINESLCIQSSDFLCKIDDFRRLDLWRGQRFMSRRYWPKDPGHGRAISQPFDSTCVRPWSEVIDSTLLILHIADMVRGSVDRSLFRLSTARSQLHALISTNAPSRPGPA